MESRSLSYTPAQRYFSSSKIVFAAVSHGFHVPIASGFPQKQQGGSFGHYLLTIHTLHVPLFTVAS
jgi:hypothetical protein